MPLIRLLADPEDETLPPPPPMLRGAEFPIDDLLLELHQERRRRKRQQAAFLSVIGHLCLLLLILLAPRIPFLSVVRPPVIVEKPQPQQQLTYLELPPDLITKKKPPAPPPVISNRDRHFDQPVKPKDSISAPVTRPAPKPVPATPPPGPVASQPPAPAQPAAPPPAATKAPEPAPQPAKDNGLKLEDIPKPVANPKLRFDVGAADSVQRAMQAAARDRTAHGQGVTETNPLPPRASGSGSSAPGQTGAGVQILTDTQGVDFDSYLRRVVEIVRRNWYAVMPETVYLGTQGKVVVVFNINANGTVPGLRPVSLSGTASLDEAAEASIKASNPFPPLPTQFHGPFITLQFSFYYNLEPPN